MRGDSSSLRTLLCSLRWGWHRWRQNRLRPNPVLQIRPENRRTLGPELLTRAAPEKIVETDFVNFLSEIYIFVKFKDTISGIWINNSFGMVEKRLDAKWSGFWMPFEYLTAQTIDYQTNGHHLVSLCTGLVFKWLQISAKKISSFDST